MAIVRLYREGKEIYKLEIEPGREYFAGRADSCHFVLEDTAISRQHLKFFYENGKWRAQTISRFGNLTHLGALHQSLELENGMRFQAGEFEFRFEEERVVEKPVVTAPPQEEVDPYKNRNTAITLAPNTNAAPKPTPEVEEKTSIGFVNAVPFVRVYNPKVQKTIDIRLEGQRWKCGRAPECQIVIDEGSASRTHFEIIKNESGFQIRDLGSSNGTRVNGQLIEQMTMVSLFSGDVITIGGTTIEFQVRDAQFTQRLEQAGIVPYIPENQGVVPSGQRVEVVTSNRNKGFKIKPIHAAIGGIFALILIMKLFGSNEPVRDQASVISDPQLAPPNSVPGNSLSAAQTKYLEDTYNLAENLFKRQKYEAALIEIKKIHELTPTYKRSRELETYAQQAIDIKAEQNEISRQQQAQEQLREANSQIIQECREKNFKSPSAAEACLQPVLENDPENTAAQALISKIQRESDKRQQERQAQENFQAEIKELTALYNKGVSQEKSGQLLNAISTFGQVSRSDMADPKGFKLKAKVKIKELEGQIKAKIKKSQQRASEYASQEKFSDALKELQVALDLEPGNTAAKSQFDKVYKDLNRRLKAIYGDSVLEESLGNVEAAKQKWNNIIEMDLETGEYYQKAKRMLKKYGG